MPRKAQSTQNTQNQTAPKAQSSKEEEVSFDIITTDSWNPLNHTCGLAKVNKSGQGKSAPFAYNKRRFFLKVPKMYCPFGASKPKLKPNEKEPENPQWSTQLSFGDDPACQSFQKKAEQFDKFMIDQAMLPENQVSWLGASKTKPFSREVVESKYTSMVKYVKKDGEITTQYPPFIRAQFPTTFKAPYEFTCELYDKNNELLNASPDPKADNCISKIITGGCMASALLSGSIWANANGFGVTWRIAQLKAFPSKGLPKGKCLVDDPEEDEDDEDVEEEQTATQTATQPAASSATNEEVEEEEEEEEEEIEEEAEEEVEEVEEEVTPESAPVPTPVVVPAPVAAVPAKVATAPVAAAPTKPKPKAAKK